MRFTIDMKSDDLKSGLSSSLEDSPWAKHRVQEVPIEQPKEDDLSDRLNSHSNEETNVQTSERVNDQTPHRSEDDTVVVKGFKLTAQLDKDLDEHVNRILERVGDRTPYKVDRSAVIRALLQSEDLTSDESVERSIKRLIDDLTRRLNA